MPTSLLRPLLWILTSCLCLFGLVMVGATTLSSAPADPGLIENGLVIRQAVAMLLGLGAALLLSRLGTTWLRHPAVVLTVLCGTLVVLALTPVIGTTRNGATRWINLGVVLVQPAEFAKLALIVVVAWHLVRVEERVRVAWYGVLVPVGAFLLLALLVYSTRDLGSVVIMATILFAMLFYAGANWIYTSLLGLGCAPIVLWVTVFQTAYRRNRLLAFLDPLDPHNPAGYHLRQSHIAIAAGGTWGVGLGQGISGEAFLPERHTDFIFAAICEELGMVGGLSIAVAFLLLTWVGLSIAATCRVRHQRLLAVGCTVLIGIQAFWNMLVVTGALPTKGLTLPFISYGGSSVVVCLLAVGVLDAIVARCPQTVGARTYHSRIGAAVVQPSCRLETW